jgi:uncharacterized protein YjbI with pentapeptide repeats
MKASEVLRRYAAGERDFRRVNLRGQSFKRQDLSGADFSEADIRGANFSHANLQAAIFTGAKAGVQRRWLVVQQVIAFVISTLSGVLSVFTGVIVVGLLVFPDSDGRVFLIPGIGLLGLLGIILITIIRQGFTIQAFLTITFAFAFVVAVVGAVKVAGAFAFAFAFGSAVAVIVAFTFVFAFAVTFAGAVAVAVVGAVAGAVVVAVADAVVGADAFAFAVTFVGAFAFSGATMLLSLYVAWRASKGDEKFALVRTMDVAFGAVGGTSFRGADLTSANFTKAILKSANFTNVWERDSQGKRRERETVLEWVCWQDAQKLDRARVGKSILADRAVRDLLVTRNGYKKSYVNAKLRTANLDGANLEQADLTWADLSCAQLRQANLKNANLSESLVLHTDFTAAHLTGACLEAWNIDSQTILDDVDCQFVYLLRPQRERRPSSGDFAPGEFTKLFQEVLSTVDLIFRNGIDWKAFVAAFQQVQVENEDTPLEIQSIENKGDGVVVVRVNVSPDANKEKIHSEFNQQYEVALQALEAKYRAELQAKESAITIYREQSANMWETINSLANRPVNIINENSLTNENKQMSNSSNQSRNIHIGGNVTGSTLNLGEISGTVTNAINQLPDDSQSDAAEPDRPTLKQLLTQLQEAIESDSDLPEPDKADLLEQVQSLAEAKQTEAPDQKAGLVRRAKKIFDATLKSLPETAKIAEACTKLLPMILRVLGVPV